jgi:hypothetical protein
MSGSLFIIFLDVAYDSSVPTVQLVSHGPHGRTQTML